MTYRTIDVRFWGDSFVENLSFDAKALFLFFVTSKECNFAGIYEISKKTISYNTGASLKQIESALKELEPKVIWRDGWVRVQNFQKYQAQGEDARKGAKKIENSIPRSILDTLYAPSDTPPTPSLHPVTTLADQNRTEINREEQSTPKPPKPKDEIPYQEIIDHLNKVTGHTYSVMPSYQTFIHARYAEFKKVKRQLALEDFFLVNTAKAGEWLSDPERKKYLRPETLYGTRFSTYLDAAKKSTTTPAAKPITWLVHFDKDGIESEYYLNEQGKPVFRKVEANGQSA